MQVKQPRYPPTPRRPAADVNGPAQKKPAPATDPADVFSTGLASMSGVRWKPPLGGRDRVLAPLPYCGGAPVGVAAAQVASHAECSTIDLTPRRKLLKMGYTEEQAAQWKAEQIRSIVEFLASVRDQPIKFFLHARVNDTAEFVADVAATIRAAEAKGVGDSLAGVMLGEHNKRAPRAYLQLALDLADEINAGTGDWLQRDKALTLHGGGFGARFAGLKEAADELDFFSQVSKQASDFSFAFKFFDPKEPLKPDQGDPTDPRAWISYFNGKLGLEEAKALLDQAAKTHPRHANMIFVGDASDGLYTIKTRHPRTAPAIIEALKSVFAGNDWRGFLFAQPFDYLDDLSARDKRGMWNEEHGKLERQEPLDWWIEWRDRMRSTQPKTAAGPTPCE